MISKSSPKVVHFVGIGGIGMSALARWFLAKKRPISGSDMADSKITQDLQNEGIKVKIGHKKGYVTSKIGLVIYSQAVKPDNPELTEARRLKISTLSYPEAIAELAQEYETITVSGAHGKSTTTAIVGLILKKAGLDPTIIAGTGLKELGGKNFYLGKSPYLALEADEFGRAFLHYSPAFAIITNIDREHLDVYKNLRGVKTAFLKFLKLVQRGGALVLNADNQPLLSLKSRVQKIAKTKKLRVFWYSLQQKAAKKIKKEIKIPGEHNVSNALAAYTVAKILKIPEKKILSAIAGYRGAWRRMEYRGQSKIGNCKLKIFDDYAHHPTEIKATLAAFREKFPNRKIICVFQPHQAKRLESLFKDFTSAFEKADILIFLPTYQVAGRDLSISSKQASSKKLAKAIRKKHPSKPVAYLKNPNSLKKLLKEIVGSPNPQLPIPSPILVMMGAGDIVKYTDLLLK